MENTTNSFSPCASVHIRIANQKYNCNELELVKEKRAFFVSFILSEGNFLTFLSYLNVYCTEYNSRINILLYIKNVT